MGGPDKGHEPDGELAGGAIPAGELAGGAIPAREPAGGVIPAGGQKLSPDPGGRGGDGVVVMVLPIMEEVLCCGLVCFALFEAGMPDPLPDDSDGGRPALPET